MSLSNTLVDLINIPSVIGNEEEITTAIEFRMAATRPALRLGNALVVGEPTGKPLVVLYGHTDTVPEQGNTTASVDADRVHGLGACDMKAGVSVMIHLLEDPEVLSGPYDVVGVFYDKEEGPSAENGLEDVLNTVGWLADAEFSVVLEPTDLNLELGCNGAMNADIIFTGHAAHSARPWLGENAVTKAGAWLAAMHDRIPEPVEIAGLEYREVFSVTRASERRDRQQRAAVAVHDERELPVPAHLRPRGRRSKVAAGGRGSRRGDHHRPRPRRNDPGRQ